MPRLTPAALDKLIAEITVDAHGEDEQLWAFRQAFEDAIVVPCDAFVIDEPVLVLRFDYDGNTRRGLTAKCRRPDGREHLVASCDVVFPAGTDGARYVAAYRRWMGLKPFSVAATPRRAKAKVDPLSRLPIDLVVLSVEERTAHCRILGRDQMVDIPAPGAGIPGEILKVLPLRPWGEGRKPQLSRKVLSTRIDAAALGLVPLRLESRGQWDPAEEYWGEPGERLPHWTKKMIAKGPRPAFEMEQVLPGFDWEDPFSDPIGIAVDLTDSGNREGAYRVLMDLCRADLRCLDAHAHLGNLAFDRRPREAMRHYEVGFRIGELSLGEDFHGVLRWGHIDNRPFLRCMQGYGLCLWRDGRFPDAYRIFDRMLWLNPSDNQGVRLVIGDVRLKKDWKR